MQTSSTAVHMTAGYAGRHERCRHQCCPLLCAAPCLPQAEVEALVSMCTADNVEQLLAGNPDYVLDAIDNIDTKVRHVLLCIACQGASAATWLR